MGEGGRGRQKEIGRDRDIARSELRHNRQGRPSAQLNELAHAALNEECETVSHQSRWALRFVEGLRFKRTKKFNVQCAVKYDIWNCQNRNFFFFFSSFF